MKLAERMVEYRAKERITLKEFAERCGLSEVTVRSIENGSAVNEPNRITVAKIELVIGKEE